MSQHHLEHSDVLRVIGQSHKSFDDAVSSALQQLASPSHGHNHHPNLTFQSFEVVKLGGYLHHDKDGKSCAVTHFSATIDVVAVHDHSDGE
ncbi:MAG: hypothetical protein AAFX93_06345 [Verrucomicrobiota bacterium]